MPPSATEAHNKMLDLEADAMIARMARKTPGVDSDIKYSPKLFRDVSVRVAKFC